MIVNYSFIFLVGEEYDVDTTNSWLFDLYRANLEFTSLPTGVSFTTGASPSFFIADNITAGTYYANYSIDNGVTYNVFEFIFVNSLTEIITGCLDDNNVNIVWRNREGGLSSYNFDQRKDFSTELGKAKTFENNGVVKYFDKGKSFYKTNVYKTGISLEEITHIKSLRQSIQAWVYTRTQPLTNGSYVDTLTPILIDNDSFNEYNTKDSFYEIELSFAYANVVKSQSQ